ncbi:MAG: hypothetical protein LBR15_02400 [Methanobrevibacter sp.]|nr:hypothetical protein [Candidatus Methanovirga australis]
MKYFKFIVMLIIMGSILFIGNINADPGYLKVEARSQDNDGDGRIILYERYKGNYNDVDTTKSYSIKKGETLSFNLVNTYKIVFESVNCKSYEATIFEVDKFLLAPVDHTIDVHVNFYDKKYYSNKFFIEGGWYKGSKNLYRPTWGDESAVKDLTWNVAANHWNNF